ncbi:MAG: CHRD domain-containing protein [Leptolyngbya sp. DLM2.Bin15]|nr:MAG: CHRD domain-containing protein [Leptolyngbya sp. DLM2.Bin15]
MKNWFKTMILAALSFVCVIGFSSPGIGQSLLSALPQTVTPSALEQPTHRAYQAEIQANLWAAQSVLMAQGMTASPFKTYVAIMGGDQIVPDAVMTQSIGTVGAALAGNRLIVRGSFRDMSSPLRDYETDPLDPPNPNITSAFHIHRGMVTENGPFQYALEVMLDETGSGGRVMGDYMLTDEQLAALDSDMLYVDVHTTRYRGGELRGILMAE